MWAEIGPQVKWAMFGTYLFPCSPMKIILLKTNFFENETMYEWAEIGPQVKRAIFGTDLFICSSIKIILFRENFSKMRRCMRGPKLGHR